MQIVARPGRLVKQAALQTGRSPRIRSAARVDRGGLDLRDVLVRNLHQHAIAANLDHPHVLAGLDDRAGAQGVDNVSFDQHGPVGGHQGLGFADLADQALQLPRAIRYRAAPRRCCGTSSSKRRPKGV